MAFLGFSILIVLPFLMAFTGVILFALAVVAIACIIIGVTGLISRRIYAKETGETPSKVTQALHILAIISGVIVLVYPYIMIVKFFMSFS